MNDTQTFSSSVTIDKADHLAALVRDAAAARHPLIDYGKTHAGVGHPPPATHTTITLTGGVIEHFIRDLTMRASTGATMGTLQQAAREHRQFLPIDADDDMTLGEVIAHHVYGPLRLKYGSVRDHLLGLRYIDGQGRDIHVGGRTVKNVAGYDLTRFMVGSLGEFGIVYEATLRTYAVPEQVCVLTFTLDHPSAIDDQVTAWMVSDACPTGLSITREKNQWRLTVLFHGSDVACSVQSAAMVEIARSVAGMTLADQATSDLDATTAQATRARAWRRSATAVVKLIVPPAGTGAACEALAAATDLGPDLRIDAQPAHGCLFVGGVLDDAATRSLDFLAGDLAERFNGVRVWHRRPDTALNLKPVHPQPATWPMLLRLKKTMDPAGIFNPGRLIPVEGQTS